MKEVELHSILCVMLCCGSEYIGGLRKGFSFSYSISSILFVKNYWLLRFVVLLDYQNFIGCFIRGKSIDLTGG